jgi:glutaconate CoA-transferase subunit B
MSEEIAFTDTEQVICSTARLIEEDRLYFVAIGGSPLVAIILARRLRAPGVAYVVEDGTVAPQMPLPMPPFLLGGSRASYRAVAWTNMNTVDSHAALGYMDYGILNAVQVDEFGNFNSTFVGASYERPDRRFGGPGGANEIASMCWRTVLMTRLQRRKFVKKLDFMSSPGYLDGAPDARSRAGLPADTGPYRVLTETAIFGFDDESHRMKLLSIAPWTTVDQVLGQMEFEPIVPDTVDTFDVPTDEELHVLRTEVDTTGRGLLGEWITVEREGDRVRLVSRSGAVDTE